MAGETATAQGKDTAAISVKIADDRMAAYVRIASTPPPGPLDPEMILTALRGAGITYGIDESAVQEAAQGDKLDQMVRVASGTPAQPGENARIEFKVELDSTHAPKVGPDGRVDYKNIDFLLNATPGTVLAVKHPAQPGIPGKTVEGREISALRGRDESLPVGTNTYASEDGLQLLARAAGSIVYAGKRISIQPISNVPGNVSMATGNINAVGSLRVKGDIEAGFTVKVEGDLEVGGNVLDSTIECGGNVLIKGGFIGQGNGRITAIGTVTVRSVENQSICAQGDITVGGEALNARLISGSSVRFKGGKAKVVGGEITARNLIWAKEMGNEAGTTTVARVGYDAELMQKYYNTKKEIERLESDLERVKEGLYVLYRLQMENKLPEAKKAVMQQLQQFNSSAPQQIDDLKAQKEQLTKKIEENTKAKIVVEDRAYPGVRLCFGLIYNELTRKEERRVYAAEYGKVISSQFDPAQIRQFDPAK